ncbi:hypothetical protein [Streptomyces kaniharaensis]|uniref:hypothetical protein n=1 Tax=Streptomyces kaniharaensis TaxID=212423 RepID=UPI0018A829C1|nr:hypothetical protein [Streptomyces kaniharaensis]
MVESRRSPADGGEPADSDVQWVYQPVEVHLADGSWALGRISGWWQDTGGDRWCRLRLTRTGRPARWEPFDPARVVLLPVAGL